MNALILFDHHIARLDVSVDDSLLVCVLQSPGYVADDSSRAFGVEVAFAYELLEVFAFDIVHDHVVHGAFAADFMHTDDARVLQPACGFGLTQEAGDHLFARIFTSDHGLDRHLAVKVRVTG